MSYGIRYLCTREKPSNCRFTISIVPVEFIDQSRGSVTAAVYHTGNMYSRHAPSEGMQRGRLQCLHEPPDCSLNAALQSSISTVHLSRLAVHHHMAVAHLRSHEI